MDQRRKGHVSSLLYFFSCSFLFVCMYKFVYIHKKCYCENKCLYFSLFCFFAIMIDDSQNLYISLQYFILFKSFCVYIIVLLCYWILFIFFYDRVGFYRKDKLFVTIHPRLYFNLNFFLIHL